MRWLEDKHATIVQCTSGKYLFSLPSLRASRFLNSTTIIFTCPACNFKTPTMATIVLITRNRVPPPNIAGCIATIGLGVGYMLIQSTLATIAFDVAPETKGLPSALIGLGLFGGGGLGAAFCGWLLPIGNYVMLWTIIAAAMLAFALVACQLPFGNR